MPPSDTGGLGPSTHSSPVPNWWCDTLANDLITPGKWKNGEWVNSFRTKMGGTRKSDVDIDFWCVPKKRLKNLDASSYPCLEVSWLATQDQCMHQYLYIPFLVGWTFIYQLFWGSPGVQGFDTFPYKYWDYQWQMLEMSDWTGSTLGSITLFHVFLLQVCRRSEVFPLFERISGRVSTQGKTHQIFVNLMYMNMYIIYFNTCTHYS